MQLPIFKLYLKTCPYQIRPQRRQIISLFFVFNQTQLMIAPFFTKVQQVIPNSLFKTPLMPKTKQTVPSKIPETPQASLQPMMEMLLMMILKQRVVRVKLESSNLVLKRWIVPLKMCNLATRITSSQIRRAKFTRDRDPIMTKIFSISRKFPMIELSQEPVFQNPTWSDNL